RGTEESNLALRFWRPPCYRYTSPPGTLDCRCCAGGALAWIGAGEQLLERAPAQHGCRLLCDDGVAVAGVLVAPLEQQPLRLGPRSSSLQRESSAKLVPVQHEHGVAALERLRPRHAPPLLVRAAVPDDRGATATR